MISILSVTETDILNLIKSDPWMMKVLKAASSLNLHDWMIGAGFVRNKVWDYLHGYTNVEVPTADIDLIYFDASDTREDTEKAYDEQLTKILDINWSVKNQARMHIKHDRELPYANTVEALSEWVETPTCVAVRLEPNGELTLFAPHGVDDLVNLVVRPTPSHRQDLDTFWGRVNGKHWLEKWPKLKTVTD